MRKLMGRTAALLAILLLGGALGAAAAETNASAIGQRIIQVLRHHYNIASNIRLTVGPLSPDGEFYSSVLTAVNGSTKKTTRTPILVTRDERFMLLGRDAVHLTNDPYAEGAKVDASLAEFVRAHSKSIPETAVMRFGPPEKMADPEFFRTNIIVQNGPEKFGVHAYVTRDGHNVVFGELFNLAENRASEVRRYIPLTNQPQEGPDDAAVTIVEFGDLECPMCARLQQVFTQDLIPKYGNKIRIVIKDFPLVQIHAWALTAAVASQCAYLQDPPAVFKYRTLIYANQNMINASNVRQLLLDLAQRVGLDRLKMATCIDSRETLGRISADMKEGQAVSVDETPTCFVNGHIVVGADPQQFYRLIDAALRHRR